MRIWGAVTAGVLGGVWLGVVGMLWLMGAVDEAATLPQPRIGARG